MALTATLCGSVDVRNMVCFALCTSLSALNFGYALGFSSPAIPSMLKSGDLDYQDFAFFGSLMTVGALLGGPVGGWCIDQLGRKRAILLSSLPFLFGYASMTALKGLTYVFTGRFLTGLGSGMVMVCVPMYIAEIATKSRRGVLGSCVEIFVVVGIFVAYSIGWDKDWRKLANAGLLLAVLAAGTACLLPESPRWLLTHNRRREALQALSALRESHADVEEELKDMEEGIRTQPAISWSELFSREELRTPLSLSLILFFFQQISGIAAVTFYTVIIFDAIIPDISYLATVIVGFVKMVVTIVACMQVDRVGRKVLVTVGGSLMSFSLLLFGMCHKVSQGRSSEDLLSWLSVLCLTGAIIGFAVGWGPVPMLYMSEVLPAPCRGKAGALAISCHWLVAFFVTKEFETLLDCLGEDGVFYLFSVCCALGVAFVWRYLPETKGKSLEEIQQYFLVHSGAEG